MIAPPSTACRASRVSFLPYVLLFVTFCDRYNWGLISAGDSLEDLLAALHASSTLLSRASKRAMQLVDSICDAGSASAAVIVHCSDLPHTEPAPATPEQAA